MHKLSFFLILCALVVWASETSQAQSRKKKSNPRFTQEPVKDLSSNKVDLKKQAFFTEIGQESETNSRVYNWDIGFGSGDITDLDFDYADLKDIDGQWYGLFIGIGQYQDKSYKFLDRPIKDAHKLHEVLTSLYNFKSENTRILDNPTRKQIIDNINEFSKKLTPKDNLLIFYAGHGKLDGNRGFWIPSDAVDSDESSWYSNSELKEKINTIDTKHTLIISDACFSGALLDTRGSTSATMSDAPDVVKRYYNQKSRRAITSSDKTEALDNSIFFDVMIKYLQKNTEIYLSCNKLFGNIGETVVNQSNGVQIPQFGKIPGGKDEGGSFIFIRMK
jgi:hypothetical protein